MSLSKLKIETDFHASMCISTEEQNFFEKQ